MHTLIQALPTQRLLLQQVPVLFASLTVAELFYRFGSFTTECLAFLGTWYVLDAIAALGARLVARRRGGRARRP